MTIRTLKNSLIENMKYLISKEMNLETEGNISIRYNNGFIISQSAINPFKMKEKNIIFIDSNGKYKKSDKPSTEWKMHYYLYQKRPDAKAVVHCHSLWASTLSCLRKNIPSFHYMVAEMGGVDVKCSRYATFGTSNLAENVCLAIENRKGCLISNHGQITIGSSIEEAIHHAFALEKLSKQFYFCLLSNNYKLLNKRQINESLKLFNFYKSKH